MKHVFIDSSVLVAACASKKGASALVLQYCYQRKIKGYLSSTVIGEARKNVFLKLEEVHLKRLDFFLKNIPFIKISSLNDKSIELCSSVINHKDAPILAAALNSKISYLLTLDKKDFLQPKVIRFVKPMKIMTPGDFVSSLKS